MHQKILEKYIVIRDCVIVTFVKEYFLQIQIKISSYLNYKGELLQLISSAIFEWVCN